MTEPRKWTQEEIDAEVFRCDDLEDCDCVNTTVEDILSGRCECMRCGRVWYD